MLALPTLLQPLVQQARPCFTAPTFERLVLLILGYVLSPGRKTLSRILQHLQPLLHGHFSSYHRVYSHARWSAPRLWRLLAGTILELLPPGETIYLVADDTVERRRGKKVWGSSIHRDPLASSRTRPRFTPGHKWLTLCALVPVPFASGHWALPLLAVLVRTPKVDQALGLGHHTVRQRVRQGLVLLHRWFPQRRFCLLGDWGVASHELAWRAAGTRGALEVIARMRADTVLHARTSRKGARKGKRLPAPREQVQQHPQELRTLTLAWYNSGQAKTLCYYSDTGLWYSHHSAKVVAIRWVWTRNPETGSEDYFYSTDLALSAEGIIRLYMLRWPVETMFQAVREHLGLETTRHHCRQSVQRVTPLQLACYSLVSLAYCQLARQQGRPPLLSTPCYAKSHVTFADALTAVRREIWKQGLLSQCLGAQWQEKLPPELQEFLLEHLSRAA